MNGKPQKSSDEDEDDPISVPVHKLTPMKKDIDELKSLYPRRSPRKRSEFQSLSERLEALREESMDDDNRNTLLETSTLSLLSVPTTKNSLIASPGRVRLDKSLTLPLLTSLRLPPTAESVATESVATESVASELVEPKSKKSKDDLPTLVSVSSSIKSPIKSLLKSPSKTLASSLSTEKESKESTGVSASIRNYDLRGRSTSSGSVSGLVAATAKTRKRAFRQLLTEY